MKHRVLRIAWSVVWGILSLLLVVMWVRSYFLSDTITRIQSSADYSITSYCGSVVFGTDVGSKWRVPHFEWKRRRPPQPPTVFYRTTLGFARTNTLLALPYWCVILLPATLAALPWLPWRFSLRTMLIAMTLLAVGLGVIVIKMRG